MALPSRPLVLTAADQVLSSTSNFAVGVLVGRLAGPADFGSYMLAFTVWLFVLGAHRALVTEPMIITDREHQDDGDWLRRGIVSEIQLALVASVVVAGLATVALAAGAGNIAGALYTLTALLVPLLVQDFWRAMSYQRTMPGRALVNDLVFAAVQAVAFVVVIALGFRSAPWLLAAWGVGAAAGAVLGWFQFALRPHLSPGSVLPGLWPMSRWLLADFSTTFAADQAYLIVAATVLGTARYGGLKAALSLMGPATVIMVSGGNLGLPAMARAWRERGREGLTHLTHRVTLAVCGSLAVFTLGVFVLGDWMLRVLYGTEFAEFGGLARIAALQFLLATTAFGAGIALKVAKQTRVLLLPRIGVAVGSIGVVIVFERLFGLAGAAWAGVVTAMASVAVQYVAYLRTVHRSDPGAPLAGGRPGATGGADRPTPWTAPLPMAARPTPLPVESMT